MARLNQHLSKTQLILIKEKLISECERIQINFSIKKAEYESHSLTGSKDEVDAANDNILLSTDMRFSNREALYYKKVLKSLSNIEADHFGMCIDCGAPINYQRLLARPTSELCIICKEESEKEENQNYFDRRSKSIGREMNVASAS